MLYKNIPLHTEETNIADFKDCAVQWYSVIKSKVYTSNRSSLYVYFKYTLGIRKL